MYMGFEPGTFAPTSLYYIRISHKTRVAYKPSNAIKR